jgi:hypothetical protein
MHTRTLASSASATVSELRYTQADDWSPVLVGSIHTVALDEHHTSTEIPRRTLEAAIPLAGMALERDCRCVAGILAR